jgi:hypothetical protein
MKSLRLSIILSAIMLAVTGVLVTGLAQAESTDRLNHNFMSKRAYQAPVEHRNANKADAEFEGATYRPAGVNDESVATQNTRKPKQLRINSFARRSFVG